MLVPLPAAASPWTKPHPCSLGIGSVAGSSDELVADIAFDTVRNFPPNHLHVKVPRVGLQAANHTVTEKPLATSGAEPAQLLALRCRTILEQPRQGDAVGLLAEDHQRVDPLEAVERSARTGATVALPEPWWMRGGGR